jgi:hypothetical protein
VRFDFSISHLVAKNLDIEAASRGADVGGATPCTVAVLPSHPGRDTFVRACNTALTHRIVCVKDEHVHVATGDHYCQLNVNEGSPEHQGYSVYIDLGSQGDGLGKRYINFWCPLSSDIMDDLCEAVGQEEPGSLRGTVVVADELKVLRAEAARPDAEWILEAQVAAARLTAGKCGGGGKNRAIRRLASLHAGCPHRCRR